MIFVKLLANYLIMEGLRIKGILRAKGVSLSEIAEKLDTSLQNLSAALRKDDIKTSLLEKIAVAIDEPVSFFYGETPAGSQATASGDGSTAIAGNGNKVHEGADKFLTELAAQRGLTEKAMEHNGRLLGIIEQLSKK